MLVNSARRCSPVLDDNPVELVPGLDHPLDI